MMPATASTEVLRASGYVVLRAAFSASELAELRHASDLALGRMLSAASAADAERTTTVWPDGHKLQEVEGTTIHWEPDAPDSVVRSLSPVTHLDPRFDGLWTDARLTEPMCDLLGVNDVVPFTSGLNLKKAGLGSEYRWHQDSGSREHETATAMIFLDDATDDNGPMCLLPGSHLAGPFPIDPADPIGQLADPSLIDESDAVTIIVEAGSVLMFPARLLHRSSPNRSKVDRRALRLCFQPASRIADDHGPVTTNAASRPPTRDRSVASREHQRFVA